ncbi:pilus assembly protein [Streptomyces sp. NBC_01476]|uniref:TadE/TadG family type IV pilus assembly protein n=1 Tax=Streptomyces sp. NBC_01476 TaxID=2903881 RepID=UPI002E30D53E|nr:TadE/TadG family type IV pilus assembly protein [Streptomyces sp. NBC_01476]
MIPGAARAAAPAAPVASAVRVPRSGTPAPSRPAAPAAPGVPGVRAAARRASRQWVRAARATWRERGVASLEYLGMLPFLLLIALAGIQLGIAAYCGEQAGTAARAAARTAAEPDPHADAAQAGANAVSGWVNPSITFPRSDNLTVTATATVRIPSVLPGLSFLDPVSRSATMPREDTTP